MHIHSVQYGLMCTSYALTGPHKLHVRFFFGRKFSRNSVVSSARGSQSVSTTKQPNEDGVEDWSKFLASEKFCWTLTQPDFASQILMWSDRDIVKCSFWHGKHTQLQRQHVISCFTVQLHAECHSWESEIKVSRDETKFHTAKMKGLHSIHSHYGPVCSPILIVCVTPIGWH